jgi:hypothetical protein
MAMDEAVVKLLDRVGSAVERVAAAWAVKFEAEARKAELQSKGIATAIEAFQVAGPGLMSLLDGAGKKKESAPS